MLPSTETQATKVYGAKGRRLRQIEKITAAASDPGEMPVDICTALAAVGGRRYDLSNELQDRLYEFELKVRAFRVNQRRVAAIKGNLGVLKDGMPRD